MQRRIGRGWGWGCHAGGVSEGIYFRLERDREIAFIFLYFNTQGSAHFAPQMRVFGCARKMGSGKER